MNKNDILNSSLEVSLRILMLLRNFHHEELDVDDILLLDYYILHINDFDSKLKSIHPSLPNRENEIFIRRQSIQHGILLLESRNLIDTNYTKNGITYSSNSLTIIFTEHLETPYAYRLKENVNIAVERDVRELLSEVKETLFKNTASWSNSFYFKESEEDYNERF